jgi:membrane protein DedA with SNARE-associated domain
VIGVSAIVEHMVDFARLHHELAPLLVFCLGFAKSLAVVSLLVPGTLVLAAIGGLAAAAGLSLWPLVLADGLGASVGFAISYYLGIHYRDAIATRWPFSRYPEALARSQWFFDRYGTFSVFLGHFFGPVRAFISVIAGVSGMKPLPFQVANVTSGFLWSFGVMAPGYYGISSGVFGSLGEMLGTLLP